MFLRSCVLRRVAACYVLAAPRSAPLRYLRYTCSLNQTIQAKTSGTNPDFLRQSSLAAVEDLVTRRDTPLHALTDRQLLKIVGRTIETRNRLPEHVKNNQKSGYSRTTGAIYTAIYLELRRRGVQWHLKGYPETFLYIARHCVTIGRRETLELVIEDIVTLMKRINEGIERGPVERHYHVLEGIIRSLTPGRGLDSLTIVSQKWCTQMIQLSQRLLLGHRPSDVKPKLSADSLSGILLSLVTTFSDWDDNTASFLEALLRCLENTPSENFEVDMRFEHGSSAKGRSLSTLSWNLFQLIRILLDKDMHNISFSFLQILLQKGVIPTLAIESSGTENDFRVFMLSVLVRSCALYGSPDQALLLLQGENIAEQEFQEHYTILANDLLSYFLAGDASKLDRCSQLFKHMLSQNPAIDLKNDLLQAFVGYAYRANATKAVETMAETLELTSALNRHMDCFIHGNVLPWLLDYMIHRSKKLGLARRLAQELVRSAIAIPPQQRGDVIALCAAGGFMSETRALWERYAVGPDAQMVTAHTRSMVGIVKLFREISDIAAKASADHDLSDEDMKETKATRMMDMTEDVTQEAAVTHGFDHDVNSRDARQDAISGNCPSESRSSTTRASEYAMPEKQSSVETPLMLSGKEPSGQAGDSEPVARGSDVAIGAEYDEYYAFALKVLEAYRSAKEPLSRASHYDLNALARASDLLGIIRLSMHALQIIVERKEVPDTRDLNVVIMAMAARDPSRAEEMLILMLQEGMHLNAHSFSAVILGWLEQSDTAAASRIYSRAMRLGHAKLHSEAAYALLVACIDACCPPEGLKKLSRTESDLYRTFLRQVYSLISSKACPRSTIPREIRARCVGTAVRLQEPGLAFYFWKTLMMTNARRETEEEKELRQAVAVLVKKATATGTIGTCESSVNEV